MNAYTNIIEYSNINVAVCDIVNKKIGVYQPFFDCFYPYVKEHFNKHYDALVAFSQQKLADTTVHDKVFNTSFYNMSVHIDYAHILKRLHESKEFINAS